MIHFNYIEPEEPLQGINNFKFVNERDRIRVMVIGQIIGLILDQENNRELYGIRLHLNSKAPHTKVDFSVFVKETREEILMKSYKDKEIYTMNDFIEVSSLLINLYLKGKIK